jgi:beta-glucosidase
VPDWPFSGSGLPVIPDQLENRSWWFGNFFLGLHLYIHQRHGRASRPVRELQGFERISLASGKKKTVRFTLGKNELSYWSAAAKTWVQDAAAFDIWIGSDSKASLHAEFQVEP